MINEIGIRVPYALSVYGNEEQDAVMSVMKSHKMGLGKKTSEFENKVSKLFGKKFGVMVNSGSSANLIATKLISLSKGSKVVTPVLTFSTTVAPLIQTGLTPSFIDIEPGTYLANTKQLRDAVESNGRAIMLPSLLGNVPDLPRIKQITIDNDAYLIEDSCDTLGATINGVPTGRYTDISTTSFYGSHVITAAGGGGMICVNKTDWYRKAKILRGWGRSSAVDETEDISKRLNVKIDNIQYDSKFVFEDIGYNLLPLEISAAFGIEQLKKLDKFAGIRNKNFNILYNLFSQFKDYFTLPIQSNKVKTSWLAFPLTITSDAPFSRRDMVSYLEHNNVQTRPIFTGNILRQPGFKHLKPNQLQKDYPVADDIMKNGFVVGCNQGLTPKHINQLIRIISKFLNRF